MATVCLSMIVKNESRVISRCLQSVKPYIDSWAIVDTGSTDGTQDIIRRELAGLPGQVIDRPWKGFAGSRNDALDLAKASGADYFLTLDADEVLCWPTVNAELASRLTDDVYGICFRLMGGEATWQRVLLARLSLPWRWVGDVHEHLECEPHEPSKTLITGAHVDSYTDGGRSRTRQFSVFDHLPPTFKLAWQTKKYRSDAAELERMATASDDDAARIQFYLAQSYCGAHEVDKAIEAYRRRAEMGGWGEEVFFSLWQIAGLLEAKGEAWEDVAKAHLAAYVSRPTRAEPLWALSVLYNDHGMPAVAELYARAACSIPRPRDSLLVLESVYEYRAADELAASLGKLGRYDETLAILEKLVKLPKLPDAERQRAEENIAFIRKAKDSPAVEESKAA